MSNCLIITTSFVDHCLVDLFGGASEGKRIQCRFPRADVLVLNPVVAYPHVHILAKLEKGRCLLDALASSNASVVIGCYGG